MDYIKSLYKRVVNFFGGILADGITNVSHHLTAFSRISRSNTFFDNLMNFGQGMFGVVTFIAMATVIGTMCQVLTIGVGMLLTFIVGPFLGAIIAAILVLVFVNHVFEASDHTVTKNARRDYYASRERFAARHA